MRNQHLFFSFCLVACGAAGPRITSFFGAWHCFRHNECFAFNNKGRLSVQRKSWLDYFAIGLVNSVLARRVSEVFGGIQITEELLSILFIKICFPG